MEEINIFIILPFKQKKKLLEYTGSSLRNCKNKYFYHSTKHKKDFFNKNGFIILLSKITLLKYPELKITWWNLLEYSGSSEQNQEIFLGYCFHQKFKKNYNVVGLLYLWVKISETWKLFEAWVKATFIENNYYDRLKFCISALVGLKSWWRPCNVSKYVYCMGRKYFRCSNSRLKNCLFKSFVKWGA